MRVAVTGGSGQLGTLVLRRLLDDRAVTRVVALDVRPPIVAGAKLQAVRDDVRNPEVGRHFLGCDALVHLAFVVTQHRPRAEFDAINVGGSENVFRAAAAAGITRIVYASSIAAYGVVSGHPAPIVEDTPRKHQVDFPYAATKYEVEALLDAFEPAHPGITVARLRPSILVGHRMEHGLGTALRHRVLPDLPVPLPVVWDEDVADAVMLALKQGARGAFNITADESKTPAELARTVPVRVVHVPAAMIQGAARLGPLLPRLEGAEAPDPAWAEAFGVPMDVSSARARNVLGWRPRCGTATSVFQRYYETVPRGLDTRIALFARVADMGTRGAPVLPQARGMHARIHLELTGPSGGDLQLLIADGRGSVVPGVPRPPTAVVTMRAATFLALLAGQTDAVSAGLAGAIKVEGDAATLTVLSTVVATFRTMTGASGVRGAVARRMSQWFAAGAGAAP